MPSRGEALALPVQRQVIAELARPGSSPAGSAPARPRAIGWNGAGGWVMVSQARQENFSRTVWITFHCRGMHLQRLGDRLAQLGELAAAARAGGRRREDHALARQMRRQRRAHRLAPGEAVDRSRRLACAAVGGRVLRRGGFQLLELQSPSGRAACGRVRRRHRSGRACSLAIISFRCATIASAPAARASASRRAAARPSSAAFSASMSSGAVSGGVRHAQQSNHTSPVVMHAKSVSRRQDSDVSRPSPAARFVADVASRSLPAYSRAARR